MTEAILNKAKYHVGCGEQMTEVLFSDKEGGMMYCPKHPAQEKYLLSYHQKIPKYPNPL